MPVPLMTRRVPDPLAEQIAAEIKARTGGRVSELQVAPASEGYRLTGKCPTYYSKQLATHAAMGLAPDLHVDNDIEVD